MPLVTETSVPSTTSIEVAFSWQPNSNYFHLDTKQLKQLIGLAPDINNLEEFLTLFSEETESIIVGYLSQIADGHQSPFIKVAINQGNDKQQLCLISATQVSKNNIAGVINPLVHSPTAEDMSSFFQQLFNNPYRGMVLTDEQTHIIDCNHYFEQATGYKVSELIGKKTSSFNAGKHSPSFFQQMWEQINSIGHWQGFILNKGKTGNIIPQDLQIKRLTSLSGENYYLGMTQNLSEKLYRVAGEEHGGIELLTQLPNESEFLQKVRESACQLKADQGMQVISFIPKFPENLEFEYKKQLASALAYHEQDFSAGFLKKAVFSIVIVYTRRKDKPHSLTIFEAIKQRFNTIKERVDAEVYRCMSQCTIGVSVLGLDADGEGKLIPHSLQAMYERHSASHSNICFFNRSLHDKIKRREILEQTIKQSVNGQKMEVYFQPILCADEWKVTRLEALCRFRDEQGKLLNTEELIRVAEDLQLVSKLDLAIADKALSQRAELVKLYGPDVEISLNISLKANKPVKNIFNDLLKVFKKHQQLLPHITLELTEAAYFNSHEKDDTLLMSLRKKGLKIAIDNFGTGQSSLGYLREGDFDLLKIDKSFINELSIGSHNYYIIKMITHLAHTLNVKVVAEGVETLQEVKVLKDLHIDYLQGFYFAPPNPTSKLSNDLIEKQDLQELDELHIQHPELFATPTLLAPQNTLREAKALFEKSQFKAFPVVVDKKCVGVLTKELFNLHATPTMGTDRETSHEYRAMDKVVSAMMETKFTTVHQTINNGEIHEKLRNKNSLPWVVIDDNGLYQALIDNDHLMQYMNDFL